MPDDTPKRDCSNAGSFAYITSLIEKGWNFFPAPFRFLLLCYLIVAIWGIFFLFPATEYAPGTVYPKCPFRALTGLHCAGCGSLRTMSCLAKGDLSTAWTKNKLAILLIPFVLWSFLAYGAKCFNIHFPVIFVKPIWIWLLLVLIILFLICRNIPIYPFTLLVPY